MAVSKTTETRYSDGSVQARQGIHLFSMLPFGRLDYEITANSTDGEEKRCRDGVLCSLCMPCLVCILSFCGF